MHFERSFEKVRNPWFINSSLTKDGALGHPRFFLGSDSAPHTAQAKSVASPTHGCAAGVYTSPILLPLVADLLESFGALHNLEAFVSTNGRKFYRKEVTPERTSKVRIARNTMSVQPLFGQDPQGVVPFRAGKEVAWSIVSP